MSRILHTARKGHSKRTFIGGAYTNYFLMSVNLGKPIRKILYYRSDKKTLKLITIYRFSDK